MRTPSVAKARAKAPRGARRTICRWHWPYWPCTAGDSCRACRSRSCEAGCMAALGFDPFQEAPSPSAPCAQRGQFECSLFVGCTPVSTLALGLAALPEASSPSAQRRRHEGSLSALRPHTSGPRASSPGCSKRTPPQGCGSGCGAGLALNLSPTPRAQGRTSRRVFLVSHAATMRANNLLGSPSSTTALASRRAPCGYPRLAPMPGLARARAQPQPQALAAPHRSWKMWKLL